ncbi:MAG: B12-binding domain-containing radical SAM protein [bacterium]
MRQEYRALLVNPWIHDFAAYDFWARPLGLLCLGAALREAGYEVSLIDCLHPYYIGREDPLPARKSNGSGKFDQEVIEKPGKLSFFPRRWKRYGIPPAAFKTLLRKTPAPDVVFVNTVMTYWYTGVKETIEYLRWRFPDTPVIVGGIYATLLPEHADRETGADHVAAGDFRTSVPPLLERLGLPAELPAQELFPAWNLYHGLLSAAVLTGRGCPYHCAYCAVPRLHGGLKRREPEDVVSELARLYRDFNITDVAFFDDALRAGGDDHLHAILEGVIRLSAPLRLHAINALHVRGLDQELANLLRRANVSTLRFGLETTSPERRRSLGDKASWDDFAAACIKLHKAGYEQREIGAYLLAGVPEQPPSEIEDGINAVIKAGGRPYLSEFSPIRGTTLWDKALACSRYDIASEPLFQNNTLLPCVHLDLTLKKMNALKELARSPFRS